MPVLKTCLVVQTVKRLPTMRETRVRSLGREDALEKKMATHYSTLNRKIPRTEEPGRLQSMGSQWVRHHWVTSGSFFLSLETWAIMITQFWQSPNQKCLLCSTRWQSRIREKGVGVMVVVVVFWIQKYAILVFSVMGNTDKYTGWFSTKWSVGVLYKLITSDL